MREIITLQVGQCGNRVGGSFWEQIAQEGPDDVVSFWVNTIRLWVLLADEQGIYLSESRGGQHIARAVLCDLHGSGLDEIRASPLGSMFRMDALFASGCGTGHNWAKGHYTEGAEAKDEIFDMIRLQFEAADRPEGLQLFMGTGGGTGSGLGTLLISCFRENYPANMLVSFSVFPSKSYSDIVVEPYNTTLTVHQLVENTDFTVCFDNEALILQAKRNSGLIKPSFDDMNKPLVASLSGITSSMRFPGTLNTNLRKISVNMIPFPRIHFFSMSLAPTMIEAKLGPASPNDLVKTLFDSKNCLCSMRLFCSPN